jgi:RNA recognition motif-containing protein
MTIYVGNLSFQATRNELTGAFLPYGTVQRVHIATDQTTGLLRGFAFVDMGTDTEEMTSIAALNGAELLGRDLRVNKATPRPDKEPLLPVQSLETGSMSMRPLLAKELAKRRSDAPETDLETDLETDPETTEATDPDAYSYGHA